MKYIYTGKYEIAAKTISGQYHFHATADKQLHTVETPLTDTSIKRTPPNNGQIFSSQNTLWQKVTPPYSGHLSTTDNKIGPIRVRYMEIPLYYENKTNASS